VIGVAHNAQEPELDWWDGKGTPGNRILMRINREFSAWIEQTFKCQTYKLPYLIEKCRIFLKDAAVMAGLGSIGKNNMPITSDYGPRIRFRALLVNRELEAAGPLAFYPCRDCSQPCRKACPKYILPTVNPGLGDKNANRRIYRSCSLLRLRELY
jgi:epoxyqueuosine reductase